MQKGLWNEYFLSYFKNNLQQTKDGEFSYCYLNYIRNEYIQKYWDVRFEQYYKRVKCPVLFLVSEEERKDERISHSLSAFTQLLTEYEIKHIENSVHAYVWMQLPQKAGEIVSSFITKYDLDD